MSARSTNGEKLGKVIRCSPETFVVEKGVFFPKDYELRYDHITGLAGNDITYTLSDIESRLGGGAETLAPKPAAAAVGAAAATARGAVTNLATGTARGNTIGRDEIRMPLMDEEIGIEKIVRETGHVHVHKTVKTEEKHVIVPVTREDVVIERVSTRSEASAAAPLEATFREQDVDVTLHEEDVRVTKRPRVREEVVVRTVIQAIDKDASASLRHEEAEVEDTRTSSDRRTDRYTTTSPGGYAAPAGFSDPGGTSRR